MWSPIVLCLLVGLTVASNPGWKHDSEYVYTIHGRNLAGFDGISPQRSGILIQATLRLQAVSKEKLRGVIERPQYAEVHTDVPDEWAEIPEDKLSWKPLSLSQKPFEVQMKRGRIMGLIVSKSCANWEINIIKSFMSQFQLNTNGDNLIDHPINTLPENGDWDNDAVYLVKEDTVSGKTETMYLIRPKPEHELQRHPQLAKYIDEDGEVIEIIKHKNFTNSQELPSYAYGFGSLVWGKPAGDYMGQFLLRESSSTIYVTGSLDKFTIQQSITFNKVVASPTLTENDKKSVVSIVNATLKEIKSHAQTIPEVPQSVHVGNLVYSYEKSSQSSHGSGRYSRSVDDNSSENSSENSAEEYQNDKPRLSDAPECPLLPYTMGNEGMSIKQRVNVVKELQTLAKSIGSKMQDRENYHHEDILDEFHKGISLVRTMNYEELQKAAKDLYTTNPEDPKYPQWTALRDMVTQSGTGPALLCIVDWIKTGKITGEDANQVALIMTKVVREPTEEYMKALFELVKSPEVQEQWPLNDTLVLQYATLIRYVYVQREESKYRFPTKVFGSFDTEQGEEFIKEAVIPYYGKQLRQSIEKNETHKSHTYIRGLGNMGTYYILPEFEPYLEGKRPATQFQRLLMVLAMDKVVESHPKTAQRVLFRIYQNPAEVREVRMAAALQLMRTVPPVEMLQVMAEYTNIDDDDYVNAIVITSIKTGADLEGERFASLRSNCQAVKHLLPEDKFDGLGNGGNYLRSYFVNELSETYKESLQIFGSDDSMIPEGLRFTIKQHKGGLRFKVAHVEAFVSSMDDLIQVTLEQTAIYQQEERIQKEKSQEQENNPFSSQNIAKLLNMQTEDAEQLEAFLLMEMKNRLYMTGFDNKTVESLPEAIRKVQEMLKRGNQLNYHKLTTSEMAVSFPSALGLPILFTCDLPEYLKVQGQFAVKAEPQISENGKINIPSLVDISADLKVASSSKLQSRLSFTSAFNHKQYFAGFTQHLQVNVPVRAQVQVDLKNKDLKMELELTAEKEIPLVHYKTVPFTLQSDITDFSPMSSRRDLKTIRDADLQGVGYSFGKNNTGLAFHVEIEHKRRFLDTIYLASTIKEYGIVKALRSWWDDNAIQYSQLNVFFRPRESTTRKTTIRLSYESRYRSQADSDSASELILNENAEPSQRQEEIMKKVATDIKNVNVVSLDASAQFEGQKRFKHVLTAAVAKSNVDPKSRVMVTYKRKGDCKPLEFHAVVKSYIPNTNGLDIEYTLTNEPMASNEIKLKFGNSESSLSKIDIQVEHRRSEERKHYIKHLVSYKQCKDEMKAGDKQLSACANVTQDANLLDNVSVKVHHENLNRELVSEVENIFQTLKFLSLPRLETSNKDSSVNQNELKLQARFHPDLQAVNITVKSPSEESTFTNIPICELTKRVVVLHPVFHLRTRLTSYAYGMDTYRPFCTVDKAHVNTYSNSTYPADISKHWTLLLQYINANSRQRQRPVAEQLKTQPENYVVLVRESPKSSKKKEIKIVVSTPETHFAVVEIDLMPSAKESSSEARGKVSVNGQEIKLSEKESYDVQEGFIQIYLLPNGEVKCEVQGAFYVLYDGTRARLTAVNGKFQNRMVGICGQFNDHVAEDLLAPQACIARDAEDFVTSYEVEGEEGKKIRESFRGKTDKCIEKKIPLYVDVITGRDYRSDDKSSKPTSCTLFQTKYKEDGSKVCFSIQPQPTCSSQCQPKQKITRNVPVHCLQKSNITKMWKKQIDNGSSPDFSEKPVHKTIQMSIPESCRR